MKPANIRFHLLLCLALTAALAVQSTKGSFRLFDDRLSVFSKGETASNDQDASSSRQNDVSDTASSFAAYGNADSLAFSPEPTDESGKAASLDSLSSLTERPLSVGRAAGSDSFFKACPAFWDEDISLSSEGWAPFATGRISAGTWKYPAGGLHLGMDLALNMYSPVYAPADGLILYADAPAADNGGYLGNWCGWPNGGGNTIAMLCSVQGDLYAITFCHLSSRLLVRPSMAVSQNDIIAYSGNSGNSTGPHIHTELFEIHVSWQEAVSYFQQSADFSFGTGWTTPAACSDIACQVRPELVFGSLCTGS